MGSAPWAKWYWDDWMSDEGVRLCSYAARGLWQDMLCLMARADPTGFLMRSDGEPFDVTSLARRTGGTETEVAIL